jgi:hypothetical protein
VVVVIFICNIAVVIVNALLFQSKAFGHDPESSKELGAMEEQYPSE